MLTWEPLERAVELTGAPLSRCGDFMYMIESPPGTHQYKHIETRNYANLRLDSTAQECAAQLENAFSTERTWGKALDARLSRGSDFMRETA